MTDKGPLYCLHDGDHFVLGYLQSGTFGTSLAGVSFTAEQFAAKLRETDPDGVASPWASNYIFQKVAASQGVLFSMRDLLDEALAEEQKIN